jgi:hypothetical protein
MGYRIAALVGALGIAAGTALAAATPVTPPPGALIAPSRLVFSWTLPVTEQSEALYIANKRDTTAGGMFVKENLVRAHSLSSDQTTWWPQAPGSPSAPLPAGHYWWLVASRDRITSERYYSAPRDFRIEVSFEVDRATVCRSLSHHWLRITLHWRGNTHAVRFKLSLLRGGRIIWARRGLGRNRIGSPGSATFTWHRPHFIKQGTVLTLREGVWEFPGGAGGGDFFRVKAP